MTVLSINDFPVFGAFNAALDTKISVDSSDGLIGTELDLEHPRCGPLGHAKRSASPLQRQ